MSENAVQQTDTGRWTRILSDAERKKLTYAELTDYYNWIAEELYKTAQDIHTMLGDEFAEVNHEQHLSD